MKYVLERERHRNTICPCDYNGADHSVQAAVELTMILDLEHRRVSVHGQQEQRVETQEFQVDPNHFAYVAKKSVRLYTNSIYTISNLEMNIFLI